MHGEELYKEKLCCCFPAWQFISALCPRMWWSSSTQAWGTWSTWGRATRNQSQVNTTRDNDTVTACIHFPESQNGAGAPLSQPVTWWCLSVSPRSDDYRWKGLFWGRLKDRRDCHHVSSLQRAWWVHWKSGLSLSETSFWCLWLQIEDVYSNLLMSACSH